jgi:hypothetical protein
MGRFDDYRDEKDYRDWRYLNVGEQFSARMTGDHLFHSTKPDGNGKVPKPAPVLEFAEGDGKWENGKPFDWLASQWHARDEVAIADPYPGDMVKVVRLANKGRSYQFEVTVVERASSADVIDKSDSLSDKFGDDMPEEW